MNTVACFSKRLGFLGLYSQLGPSTLPARLAALRAACETELDRCLVDPDAVYDEPVLAEIVVVGHSPLVAQILASLAVVTARVVSEAA